MIELPPRLQHFPTWLRSAFLLALSLLMLALVGVFSWYSWVYDVQPTYLAIESELAKLPPDVAMRIRIFAWTPAALLVLALLWEREPRVRWLLSWPFVRLHRRTRRRVPRGRPR